ncbi:hypothetical protein DL98DRAFT_650603 [Cadophora sp. DSE1049]|nr:hypothetical protein DL98DRAFT_650603 [Cadophora sp. DSE1049]
MSHIKRNEHLQHQQPSREFEAPPPSYNIAVQQRSSHISNSWPIPIESYPSSSSSQTTLIQTQPSRQFKPIVIPQTSASFLKGAFFSPFTHAYATCLQDPSISISEVDFLAFIDEIASYLGMGMSFVPLHPVMFAGMGLQAAAGATSFATSWTRAKSYVKKANDEIFLPKGLRCKVLKTKKMLVAVGHHAEQLTLPPLETEGSWADEGSGSGRGGLYEDPSMRRVRALGNRVAALQTEGLSQPGVPEGWWKRVGSKEAVRRDRKMNKELMKERRKWVEEAEKARCEGRDEGKKEEKGQKVAGRVFWIVIQREEVLGQVGLLGEDVESLESR